MADAAVGPDEPMALEQGTQTVNRPFVEQALEPGDNVLIADVHPVVPDNARFTVMNTGIIARRNRINVSPQGKGRGPYNPGDTIRIQFPNDTWADMSTAVLKFRVNVYGTTKGTGVDDDRFCVIQNSISSIFNLVALYQGSNNPERIDQYNLLSRVLTEFELNGMHQESIGPSMGIGKNVIQRMYQSPRATSTAANPAGLSFYSVEYCLPLHFLGLWRLHYVPFKRMAQWFLELHLDRAENVLIVDNQTNGFASGTYEITDINLIMDALEPKKWYEDIIDEMILAPGGSKFKFFFDTWRHNTVNPSGLRNEFKFTEKVQSIKELLVTQRHQYQINTFNRDSGATVPANLHSYQFKIGSQVHPYEPIRVFDTMNTFQNLTPSGEPFQQVLTSLNMWRWDLLNTSGARMCPGVDYYKYYGFQKPIGVTGANIAYLTRGIGPQEGPDTNDGNAIKPLGTTATTVDTIHNITKTSDSPQFALYVNFEKDRGFLSGINTFADNIDISLRLNYNDQPDQVVVDLFWCFNQVIQVYPNGDIGIFA